MKCENISNCPFFNDKMPIDIGIGYMYKKRYCEGDKTLCARYKVGTTLGRQYVPTKLFPNMHDAAAEIIAKHK